MSSSYIRGHKAYWNGEWRYCDNDQIINDTRICAYCKQPPTPEGFDACLGHIKNVVSACCGHGVAKRIMIIK